VSSAATSDPTIPAGGGGGGSGARAYGGPVFSGGAYLVGERGPELFTPDRAGQITPNHRLGNTWNVTINTNQSATRVIDDIRYLQMLGASA
jgi:SLT domain-containing protein